MVWRSCKSFRSRFKAMWLISVEQTYNVLWATMEVYLSRGLISASKVLDIRQVDVSSEDVCLRAHIAW